MAPQDNYVDLPETGGGAGVTSLNGETGNINIVAGSNITVTPSGQSITIASTGGGGSGTVTSVDFADGSSTPIYTISGNPVTTSGTITETLKTQVKNTVFSGPTTGADAQPAFRTLGAADLPSNSLIGALGITIDGGGATPTTGQKGFIYVPYACTINSVTMLADQSGSAVIDIWKVAYASFPPSVGNTITASALPTLSSQQNSQDTTLTGWTKSISAGDVLAFNVNSASTLTRINLTLKVTKT